MARIKIKDLPKDMKVSREEMKKIRGGYTMIYRSPLTSYFASSQPLVYTGQLTPINWGTPQYQSACGCMGMSQDPKTEFLPG